MRNSSATWRRAARRSDEPWISPRFALKGTLNTLTIRKNHAPVPTRAYFGSAMARK
jgi:hypothetical protein